MNDLKFLSASGVRAALDWDELIATMESALIEFSAGNVIQPVREWLNVEEGKRYLGVMPAVAADSMGLKVVSFYPQNAGTQAPSISALVILMNPATGEPFAIMDGAVITAMRTAAVSAAVTKRLASPDACVLTLLGSGVQAASHLAALKHVRSFSEVRVWNRTPEDAKRFAAEHGAIAMDAETAVRDADVIVTATPAQSPILMGAWLKPGAHVNAIGAPMPTWRELDDEAMSNVVVVDSREAAMKESGDLILSGARVRAEIGELFSGSVAISPSETTIFKSVGLAIEDIAAAKLAFDKSTES